MELKTKKITKLEHPISHGLLIIIFFFILACPSMTSAEQNELIFASNTGWGYEELMNASGISMVGIVGPWLFGWDILMPDGENFDKALIVKVDNNIKKAANNGQKILYRLRSGGNNPESFKSLSREENYPVDLTNYPDDGPSEGYKNGEYIGPQLSGLINFVAATDACFPPTILTDDSPGNTSPWYDFCYAIASRYNGKTPDPNSPGEYLPEVEYFSTPGEMDTIHYWYGTSSDYYGKPDKNGNIIGFLPTLYRAVKAANPNAKVVDGAFSYPGFGWRVVYEKALEEGEINQVVADYNKRYWKYNILFGSPNVDYLRNFLNEPQPIRARLFIDKCFEYNQFWDIYCFHSYDDYLMHDQIDFMKKKMAEKGLDRPIWGREMGIPANPISNPNYPHTDTAVASRFMKKFVSSFGAGASVCTVTPFISRERPTADLIPGPGLYKVNIHFYRFFNPNASVEEIKETAGTVMLDSLELLTQNISDCTVESYMLNRDAAVYIFSNATKSKKVIFGWTENIDDQLNPAEYIDNENYKKMILYNHIGEIQKTIVPKTLTSDPFVIVLNEKTGASYNTHDGANTLSSSASTGGGGCSSIPNLTNNPVKNDISSILIWIAPFFFIYWKRFSMKY